MKNLLILSVVVTTLACGKTKPVLAPQGSSVSNGDTPVTETKQPIPKCPELTGTWVCSDSQGHERWTETIVTQGNKYQINFEKSPASNNKREYVADGRVYKTMDPSIGTILIDEFLKKAAKIIPKSKLGLLAMDLKMQIDKFKVNAQLSCGPEGELYRNLSFESELKYPMVLAVTGPGQVQTTEKIVSGTRQINMDILGKFTYTPSNYLSLLVDPLKDDMMIYSENFTCTRKQDLLITF